VRVIGITGPRSWARWRRPHTPYELLTGDMSAVNYSSFRAACWGSVTPSKPTAGCAWCRSCSCGLEEFIDIAFIAGEIPSKTNGVRFTPPKFESVDPLKDAMAEKVSLRTGALTWPEMVASHGQDPDGQLRELIAWNKKFDDGGVIPGRRPAADQRSRPDQCADQTTQSQNWRKTVTSEG